MGTACKKCDNYGGVDIVDHKGVCKAGEYKFNPYSGKYIRCSTCVENKNNGNCKDFIPKTSIWQKIKQIFKIQLLYKELK